MYEGQRSALRDRVAREAAGSVTKMMAGSPGKITAIRLLRRPTERQIMRETDEGKTSRSVYLCTCYIVVSVMGKSVKPDDSESIMTFF